MNDAAKAGTLQRAGTLVVKTQKSIIRLIRFQKPKESLLDLLGLRLCIAHSCTPHSALLTQWWAVQITAYTNRSHPAWTWTWISSTSCQPSAKYAVSTVDAVDTACHSRVPQVHVHVERARSRHTPLGHHSSSHACAHGKLSALRSGRGCQRAWKGASGVPAGTYHAFRSQSNLPPIPLHSSFCWKGHLR